MSPYANDLNFFQLMDDQFGNYVLQKMFENSDSQLQN